MRKSLFAKVANRGKTPMRNLDIGYQKISQELYCYLQEGKSKSPQKSCIEYGFQALAQGQQIWERG